MTTLSAPTSEDELCEQIAQRMQSAWTACQPALLRLHAAWFPDLRSIPATAGFSIHSRPIGPNARTFALTITIDARPKP